MMRYQHPLLFTFLLLCLAGSSFAQSRIGAVLNTMGDGDGDRFGATVSLSSDGSRIAVMAPDNGRFGRSEPKAEVYELRNGTWVKLGATLDDYFTSPRDEEATVALSGDGRTVATGEAAFNTVQNNSAGRVVAYRFSGSSWSTLGNELTGNYADANYGSKIALIENGAQLMTANFGGGANDRRGVFNLILGSNQTWQTVGSQPILQSTNEIKLTGIALSEQGLNIGMGLDKGPGAPGEVQFFRFAGDWVSRGSLTGAANGDGFGTSIAMGDNGNITVVGAPNDGAGKVRVYDLSNNQIGSTIEGGAGDQKFGYSVAISEAGTRIAIGAPDNDLTSMGSGNAYVYDLVNGDWTRVFSFNGTVPAEQLGQSISLSEDGLTLAIGRPGFESAGQSDAGQVDVFRIDGSSSTIEKPSLKVSVFPNPTTDHLRITGLPAASNFFVRDAQGKLIFSEAGSDQLDVSRLATGNYFLEIVSPEGNGNVSFNKN